MCSEIVSVNKMIQVGGQSCQKDQLCDWRIGALSPVILAQSPGRGGLLKTEFNLGAVIQSVMFT